MKKSTAALLEEFRREWERKSSLTREDLEREYEDLKQSGFDIGKLLQFTSDLSGSKQIEYHYELLLEDWKRPKANRLDIEDSFKLRRKQGRDFLFPLLDTKDEFESVHIAYLIASSFSSCNETDEIICEKKKLIPFLIRYAELDSPELRRMAIIALGWVYTPEQLGMELDCLLHHLLKDTDALCRAWSASALMQLYFHKAPLEVIKERSLSALQTSLKTETDDFAAGVTIECIQELWNKKFRLSNIAIEERNHEAIEKARRSALRFLNKIGVQSS